MLASPRTTNQIGLFNSIESLINQKHPLYKLANTIDWKVFEDSFTKHYSEKTGKPAKPIRLMVGLLILKYLRNLSDENVVEHWSENIYFQYFSGEQIFQPAIPCVPTELVVFRQRIGEAGMELILKESIRINKDQDDKGNDAVVSVDTTVQEKNITYPTDDKLYKKIIKKCWIIGDEENIDLRQSYRSVVKKLSNQQRFKNTKYGAKAARKASKKIKIIAGRLIRDIARKLPLERLGLYLPQLKLFQKVLSQKRDDTNKIYSLHEPNVKCYSKGKEHKKYEFGSKVSILIDQQTGVIKGAINFTQPLHDSKTLPEVLEQYERLNEKQATEVYVDRGYKGIKQYKESKIFVPAPNKNISKKQRKRHSRRSAIEPVIGHLKQDYRLCRNFLKGIPGDNMNVILSAAAWNFRRRIILWLTEAIRRWLLTYTISKGTSRDFYLLTTKPTF